MGHHPRFSPLVPQPLRKIFPLCALLCWEAFDLDLPLGTTEGGVDHDSHADRENSAPSLFSSAGLSVGAFLRSPYESNPAVGNLSEPAPDIQVICFSIKCEIFF